MRMPTIRKNDVGHIHSNLLSQREWLAFWSLCLQSVYCRVAGSETGPRSNGNRRIEAFGYQLPRICGRTGKQVTIAHFTSLVLVNGR